MNHLVIPLDYVPSLVKLKMIWALIRSLLGDSIEMHLAGRQTNGRENSATKNGEGKV